MTPEELKSLFKEWQVAPGASGHASSFLDFLLNKLSPRYAGDKVPRCLNCGTCVPVQEHPSIYSEFCACCRWVNKT